MDVIDTTHIKDSSWYCAEPNWPERWGFSQNITTYLETMPLTTVSSASRCDQLGFANQDNCRGRNKSQIDRHAKGYK